MKILTAQQIYEADDFTIKKQGISSDALMERAAEGLFNWMHSRLKDTKVTIHLFCGIGNNGGDGIALARLLFEHGYDINVYVVNYSDKRANDFLINLDRLKERKLWPSFLEEKSELPKIGEGHIIVDAIFGIGLNRTPAIWVSKLIKHLNESKAFILSVDIPSGLYMNKVPAHTESVIKADYVLSFQVPKLPFFLPQTGIFIDGWQLLDIGLDNEYIDKVDAHYKLVEKKQIQSIYRQRPKFSHKGDYGHAVVVGGSYGKIGAVLLATKACLNSGAGLVSSYVPKCGYIPLQTVVPEAMVMTGTDENMIAEIEIPLTPSVVCLGMGMGTSKDTVAALKHFLQKQQEYLVLDADGLNILAKNKALIKRLPKQTVMTPHPKELERLIGKWKDDFDKLEKATSFSKKYDCILVIKGAHTIVVYKGKGYVNTTGNPGMATAGSGDVLAGIIASLISQKYSPLNAAIFGVYLHGLAGDIGATELGQEALTAMSIIDYLGKAYLEVLNPPTEESKDE